MAVSRWPTSIVPRHLSAACLAISNLFCLLIWCFLYTTSMMMRPMPPMMPTPTRMNTPAMFFSPSVFGVFSNCSHCWTFPWKIHSLSSDSMKPPAEKKKLCVLVRHSESANIYSHGSPGSPESPHPSTDCPFVSQSRTRFDQKARRPSRVHSPSLLRTLSGMNPRWRPSVCFNVK